jgi:Membrane-associated phospholipid phosphatase
MRTDSPNDQRYRLLGSAVSLGVGAGALAWLSPGDPDGTGPARVADGVSTSAYRWVNDAVAGAPGWVDWTLEAATQGTLVILALLLVLVWWTALRRGDTRVAAGAIVAGAGTAAAYLISEVLKATVDEERPCRVVHLAHAAIADCPAVGDWSFPSNHTTIAVGLALGLAVLRPRLAALTLTLGVLGGLLRIMVGVHYPHDVLAGALLGACVVTAAMLALTPQAIRLLSQLLSRLPSGRFPAGPGASGPSSATGGRHRSSHL